MHVFSLLFLTIAVGILVAIAIFGKKWLRWTIISFMDYDVPKDVPVATALRAKITINGDIEGLLKRCGSAHVIIEHACEQ